jgi:mannose-1-phosphate guanylyltransferase
MQITNLILSGGSGTRLWPLSRKLSPKQFYPLLKGRSLFELTVERNAEQCQRFMVVTNQDQYLLALRQLGGHQSSFVLEPVGRNTAPAIALACLMMDPEEIVLVTPSDHLIKKQAAYQEAVEKAVAFAKEGFLVTFGIQPTYAETGFGYIEAAGNEVRSFREKPDAATAQQYLAKGNYYWNSGMFCFTAGSFLRELQLCSPDVYTASQAAAARFRAQDEVHEPDFDSMMAIPDISIDYGVMEKSSRVRVVPADIGWSDLGSFDALYDELPTDAHGNTLQPNSLNIDANNNLLLNVADSQLVMLGVSDLFVVQTPSATLIGKKGQSQDVKKVVDALKKHDSPLLLAHESIETPYGSSKVALSTPHYSIEEARILPQQSMEVDFEAGTTIQLVLGASMSINDRPMLAGQVVQPNEDALISNDSETETAVVLVTRLGE